MESSFYCYDQLHKFCVGVFVGVLIYIEEDNVFVLKYFNVVFF